MSSKQNVLLRIDPKSCPICKGGGWRIGDSDVVTWCECPLGEQIKADDAAWAEHMADREDQPTELPETVGDIFSLVKLK
jgi:hypothetical protein